MGLQVCCAALSSQYGLAGRVAQSNIELYSDGVYLVVFM